ncbi:MAG: hypothetical protein IJ706_09575 [Clostridia bacterium]|nr:hypothetical protein [Clostridia bacterium]
MNEFLCPDLFFGPAWYWVWNGNLDKDVIKKQLAEMAEGGVKIVCPIPEPKQFRPLTMKTLLEDYLTPEYWEYFSYAAEEAKKLGMDFWFYDEGGWPSGGACGKVTGLRPDLQETVVTRADVVIEESILGGDTVAFFDGKRRIKKPEKHLGEKATRFYKKKVVIKGNPLYPSLLEKDTTDTFIALSHDGLYRSCEKMLGENITVTFTDEPSVKCYPWPKDIEEDFKKAKGYDLVDYLPAVCTVYGNEDLSEEYLKACIDYYDYWSARYAENYFGRIRTWDSEHGLLSGGHLAGDDETAGSVTHDYGHIMRILRAFDIPGIDVIWRQIFPSERIKTQENGSPYKGISEQYANHYFPRYASSAAHQQGLRFALTETAGVYGGGFTFSQNHYVLGYQLVRGINIISEFGFSYVRNGFLRAGERPIWFDKVPGWASFSAFNDLIARESYLCSLGSPAVDTALYIPIKDIWASIQTRENAVAIHDRAAYILERSQVCFDIFDDDVLEQGEIIGGALRFGGADYKCLVIPENRFIDRKRIQECLKAGIEVVWVSFDEFSAPKGCICVKPKELKSVVERAVVCDCEDLRVLKRQTKDGNLYMLFNEGLEEIRPTIVFDEKIRPVEIDAMNAAVRSAEWEEGKDGYIYTPRIASGESVYLLFADVKPNALPRYSGMGEKFVLKDFSFRPIRRFVIGKDDFRDETIYATVKKKELGGWKGELGEDFSGECVYSSKFTLTEEEAKKYRFISLGKVEYFCKVNINGKVVFVIAEPFVAEISGKLKKGENVLEITVANTVANQYFHTKNFNGYSKEELGPYHEKSKQFESESLGGGLYGPVELIEK